MKKLTKEQAEMLKQHFLATIPLAATPHEDGAWYVDDVSKAIDRCTEKPFPEAKLEGTAANNYHIYLEDGQIWFKVDYNLNLSFQQFLQLAKECNKIAEWIEN